MPTLSRNVLSSSADISNPVNPQPGHSTISGKTNTCGAPSGGWCTQTSVLYRIGFSEPQRLQRLGPSEITSISMESRLRRTLTLTASCYRVPRFHTLLRALSSAVLPVALLGDIVTDAFCNRIDHLAYGPRVSRAGTIERRP